MKGRGGQGGEVTNPPPSPFPLISPSSSFPPFPPPPFPLFQVLLLLEIRPSFAPTPFADVIGTIGRYDRKYLRITQSMTWKGFLISQCRYQSKDRPRMVLSLQILQRTDRACPARPPSYKIRHHFPPSFTYLPLDNLTHTFLLPTLSAGVLASTHHTFLIHPE